MNFIFKGEIIDYDFYLNKNKPTIIFLHGWGGNKYSFQATINLLKNNYSILTLTMPTIKQTNLSWNMFDYCALVEEICKLNNIENCYVVCHSFGLRVATLLKDKINVEKIVITGGAGMKKNNIIKRTEQNNNIILLKKKKFKFLFNKVASKEYFVLSKTNKKTFKNVVNFKTNKLSKFDCPMLLFWGKKDTETPPWICKKLSKLNPKAKCVFVDGDHFAYLNFNSYFNKEIIRFFEL